jgi:hypothetical protein
MTVHSNPPPTGSLGPNFLPAEWDELIADDVVSAKVVVGLMISIFTIGLVLYTIVALTVAA